MFSAGEATHQELQQRYKMDPALWKQSNRTAMFYKLNLNHILYILLANIMLYALAPFGRSLLTDVHFIIVFMTVLAISVVAYFVTSIFIDQMMGKLCDKGGLFGKDLNKLGEQATKEKV